jgi:hypothetical protein
MENLKELRKKHEEALELLDAIELHQKHIRNIDESLAGYAGLISSVKHAFALEKERELAILEMLEKRYISLF